MRWCYLCEIDICIKTNHLNSQGTKTTLPVFYSLTKFYNHLNSQGTKTSNTSILILAPTFFLILSYFTFSEYT